MTPSLVCKKKKKDDDETIIVLEFFINFFCAFDVIDSGFVIKFFDFFFAKCKTILNVNVRSDIFLILVED